MPREKEKNQMQWDKLAASYYQTSYLVENCYSYSFPIRQRHIIEMINDLNGNILDIGGGPGVLVLSLPNVLNRELNVCCVDISRQMLNHARKRINEVGIRLPVHFIQGDIESLSLPDSFFNIVICAGVLEYLESDEQAFRELNRVLKPGGTAIFTVPTKCLAIELVAKTLRSIKLYSYAEDLVQRRTMGSEANGGLDIKRKTYWPWQLDKLASKLGFQKVESVSYHFIIFPFYILFPSLSLLLGKKLQNILSRDMLGRLLGRGYILKAKKIFGTK